MCNNPERLAVLPGRMRDLQTGIELPLNRLAAFLDDSERIAVGRWQAPQAPEDLKIPDDLRLHGLPHTMFSFGAHFAAVEVDAITGQVSVEDYFAITESGNILNPQAYEQQIHGAVAQGIGYGLFEDFSSLNGISLTRNFFTYILPTSVDIPDIQSMSLPIYEQTGPFGLKGVGEVAVNGPLPAISNAVADAIGRRITDYPISSEKILEILSELDANQCC
jgi:CO/xanthine dehydrogenase Mo-binding subunit